MDVPKIEPINVKQYEVKQSKYSMTPTILFRSIILGPSGSGKTILLQNMILDIYRGCFSRIYIFSPSIDVDSTWIPVKKYIKDEMKVEDDEKDPIYFSEYDPEKLHHIIQTQSKVTDYIKSKRKKRTCSVF